MEREWIELFVPGRLCLFGEHSDWAGGHRRQNPNIGKGYALVAPTNQGTYARVKKIDEPVFRFKTSLSTDKLEIRLEPQKLLKVAEKGGLFSYVAGTVHEIITSYYKCSNSGVEIDSYKTDLPIKKGVSSSASVCVLVAKAFNEMYDLGLTKKRLMEIAYFGEITTPSRCGKMDQACAYDQPVLMTFDGDKLVVEELNLKKEIPLLIVDLKSRKDTVKILADLNEGFPWPSNDIEKNVHRYLGKINKRIVTKAREAIEDGNSERIGFLMDLAQDFFDEYLGPASPEEFKAPVLHSVLEMPEIRDFIYGGKGVGSGGDGTAQLVCKSKENREKVKTILHEKGLECLDLDLIPSRTKKDNLGVLVSELHKKIPIRAYVAREGNIDIGTPDLLKEAEEEASRESK
jgi:galactokinase